jgi:hypothetical protein
MTSRPLTIVMMEGFAGAGKSTLAKGLAGSLGDRALLFDDAALFTTPEFETVARAFREKAFPDPPMMLAAYRALFDRVRGRFELVVSDWSCVGMIEDLPCAQVDRTSTTTHLPGVRADMSVLSSHARDVRALVDTAILLVLDAPVATTITRAYEQRGEAFFEPWGIAEHRGDGTFLDAAIRYWERGVLREQDCVQAHRDAGWDVIDLDATASIEEVLSQALAAVA